MTGDPVVHNTLENVRLTRRTFLASTAALLGAPARAAGAPRVVSLDWSLTEVALSLGLTPLGTAEASSYRTWVGEPNLPTSVVDVGLRTQPNLELLQQLNPDLILTIPERSDIAPVLRNIAPLMSLPIYTSSFAPYERSVAVTRELAAHFDRKDDGERAIAAAGTAIANAKSKVAPFSARPVSIVRFVDASTVFVFSHGGLFDDVLKQLSLRNGWGAPPSYWGYARTGVAALAKLPEDTQLFYLEAPLPPDVKVMMREDPLWKAMPFVRSGSVRALPSVWFFGALTSATRFADALASRFESSPTGRHDG